MAKGLGIILFRLGLSLGSIVCLGGGVALPILQVTELPLLWLLLWPGLVYGFLAILYFLPPTAHPGSYFCKSLETGQLPWLLQLVFAPFLAPLSTLWYLKHRCIRDRVENPYDQVSDTIFLGRYPITYAEFPQVATAVVDLTAEFNAPRAVLQGRR